MNLIALGIVLLVGYIWLGRGFLSSLLNLACVVVAGAIAFGVWEIASLTLLKSAPSFARPMAWGLGLAVPFAVSLALLRAATDAVIRANAKLAPALDGVFGAVCGVIAGVVVSGIIVISIGNLHLERGALGYQPLDFSVSGNVTRDAGLWVPTDRITSAFYETLSLTSLRTGTPMGRIYPAAHELGFARRMSYADGRARNTFAPGDFDYLARYTVGAVGNVSGKELLSDRWDPSTQQLTDVSGDSLGGSVYIEGYMLNFKPGSKEKFGQTVVGAGQVTLIVEPAEGGPGTPYYPIAVVCRTQADTVSMARFRFNARDTFFSSVGGDSESRWAIEFAVPRGSRPVALVVKGIRVPIDASRGANHVFENAAARDDAIMTGALMGAPGALPSGPVQRFGPPPPSDANFDRSGAVTIGNGRPWPENEPPEGFSESNVLPFTIQRGGERGLELAPDSNLIQDGEARFDKSELQHRGIDSKLRVERLINTADTAIVQIDVSVNQAFSWLNNPAAFADSINQTPTLYDTNSIAYQAIGFIYQDSRITALRFTPGRTVASLTELPASLSRSRPDQTVRLLFRVSRGVEIREFALGRKTVAYLDPAFKVIGRSR
ncbi:MAG: CvpA family protein [Phycisphaerae bacterium]|nr:CvpA family protein [Phycisphaerae bacterium]